MIARFLANAAALFVATMVLPGITLEGDDWVNKTVSLLIVAAIFGVLNAIVKPILKLITLPAVLITIGLFLVVINAVMLMLTSWVAEQIHLTWHVSGWWTALFGSLIVSFVSYTVGAWFTSRDRDRR
ncbi:MAG: hypothetical protein CR980_00085 [Propionibacteriales bacterium]|nr:MAG: hypothetical protein CR980_00085 [Propionibacteriales bacterium]